MKMTYYKLRDLLAAYGVGFYFSNDKVEFHKKKNTCEVRKVHDGYNIVFKNEEDYITELYRLIMEPREDYCYLFGIMKAERLDDILVKQSVLSFDDEAGRYDFKYVEDNPDVKDIIFAYYAQAIDLEKCSSTVAYSLSEIYQGEGLIRIETGSLSCEMGIHKNNPGEDEEGIYGWFNGVFQSEAPAVVESSEQLKKIMGVLTPDLLESFENKIQEDFYQKHMKK